MKNLLLLLFFLHFQTKTAAQPHPAWRHYTLENGLPDNAIYSMCLDLNGHLWLATASGITMFDGYRFRRFPGPDEINAISVFCPQVDSLGRVWFINIFNQIYFVERDTIRAWEHNSVFEKYRGKHGVEVSFSIFENNSILKILQGWGFVRVFHDGRVEEFPCDWDLAQAAVLPSFNHQIRTIALGGSDLQKHRLIEQHFYEKKLQPPIQLHQPNRPPEPIAAFPKLAEFGYEGGIRLGERHYLFASHHEITEIRNGQTVRHGFLEKDKAMLRHVFFEKLADGRFAMPIIQNRAGLRIYRDLDAIFHHRPDTILLAGEDCTQMLLDQQGGIWVSTLQNGVFYLPNPHLSIWDINAQLPTNGISHLAAGEAGEVFFSTTDHQIFRINTRTASIENIPQQQTGQFVKHLFFDKNRRELVVGSGQTTAWDGKNWRELFCFRVNGKSNIADNGYLPSRDPRFYYSLSPSSVEKISFQNQKISQTPSIRFYTLTLPPVGSHLWLAKMDGLHEWVGDSVLRPLPDRPEPLARRVRQIEWASDSTLVAATYSSGVVFWKPDFLKTGKPIFFKKIGTTEGLPADRINCLALAGDSVVWVGTNAGLGKISNWKSKKNCRVEQITRAHGLPSNQINGLAFADGFLWVATTEGLVRLADLPRKSPPTCPFLQEIFVENQKMADGKTQFPAEQNNFQFKFYALNYRQNGQILYRFRLSENAAWQQTMAIEALFSSLAPGKYRFEVQAQNEDKIWGESAVFEFEIRPPWWQTWQFRAVLFLLAGAVILAFYKWRTGRLKRRFALQRQLADLEHSALRAQMNPHFISNCLNSIQKLVLENDNSAAVRYLARFAKLTRSALDFSGRSEIALDEEIAYLKNYLTLEKLRFKEKFDFQIEIQPDLEAEKIMLPPMLVQPLAENALKHGFEKMTSGGLLEIHFSKIENLLHIEVVDNGQGLPENSMVEKLGNSSGGHALQIIRRRFELLRATGRGHFFQIENRRDGLAGAVAVLEIQLKN